jgi:hypothetical protein
MSRKWNVISRIVKDPDGISFCPECGTCLEDERSIEHLRMFHSFMRHCFESWPEECEFIPDNQEHLRAWLLVKVKHREPHHVFPFASKRERLFAEGLLNQEMRFDRARGVYGFVVVVPGGVAILRPASIAIHGSKAISEKKFVAVSDAVFRFVLEFTGIDFQLWKELYPARKQA